jgi:hypothetical protein
MKENARVFINVNKKPALFGSGLETYQKKMMSRMSATRSMESKKFHPSPPPPPPPPPLFLEIVEWITAGMMLIKR